MRPCDGVQLRPSWCNGYLVLREEGADFFFAAFLRAGFSDFGAAFPWKI